MAWTVTTTVDKVYPVCSPMGNEMVVFKLDCTSDASGTTVYLESELGKEYWESIRGKWLYGILVVPASGGDAPGGVFSIDFQGTDSFSWIDEDGLAVDAKVFIPGSDEGGVFPPVEDGAAFVSTTLENTKKAVFYIYVLRG